MPKFTEKDKDRLMRLKGATGDGSVMNAVMNNNLLDLNERQASYFQCGEG